MVSDSPTERQYLQAPRLPVPSHRDNPGHRDQDQDQARPFPRHGAYRKESLGRTDSLWNQSTPCDGLRVPFGRKHAGFSTALSARSPCSTSNYGTSNSSWICCMTSRCTILIGLGVGAGNERPPTVRVIESVPDRRRGCRACSRRTSGCRSSEVPVLPAAGWRPMLEYGPIQRVADRIDQKVRHDVRGFRGEHLLKARFMLQQNLAVSVKNSL